MRIAHALVFGAVIPATWRAEWVWGLPIITQRHNQLRAREFLFG